MSASVVIVEDDPGILELLHDVLAGDGFEVITVARPDIRHIREASLRPDLFLIDLMLPGMSGVELATELRWLYPHTPMVAMSASRIMLEVANGSGLFQETLPKPFNLSTLLDTVERYAGTPDGVYSGQSAAS